MKEASNQIFEKRSILLSLVAKEEVDLDEQRKRILFSLFMAFIIPAILIFGILHIRGDNHFIGLVNIITAIGLVIITFLLRRLKHGLNIYRIGILYLGSLLIYWLKLGGVHGSYSLWIFVIPLFTFYLLGKKEGLIWMIFLFSFCLVILFIPPEFVDSYTYSIHFKIRLIVVFILIAFSTYNYEIVRENAVAQMKTEQDNLKKERKKIISSIEYAQRIQNSLLPNPNNVRQILPDSFMIWQPRDIVGGDIYYVDKFSSGCIVAVIDCTGHGVPGAIMTMLASSGLRRITVDENCLNPAKILERLNTIVKTALHQDTEYVSSNDGMDASICYIHNDRKTLIYSGARLSLIYMKNGEVIRIKGNRQSIGYKKSDLNFEFTNHHVNIADGMTFYLHTDGIVDQLGHEKQIPMGNKKFSHLLLKCHNEPFAKQQKIISEGFEAYRGDNEIQDDITVIGFSI